jgi:hypothetical protein
VAVFEEQISSQVTSRAKNQLKAVRKIDRELVPSTTEADVIRAALALGMIELERLGSEERVGMYARHRRGLS